MIANGVREWRSWYELWRCFFSVVAEPNLREYPWGHSRKPMAQQVRYSNGLERFVRAPRRIHKLKCVQHQHFNLIFIDVPSNSRWNSSVCGDRVEGAKLAASTSTWERDERTSRWSLVRGTNWKWPKDLSPKAGWNANAWEACSINIKETASRKWLSWDSSRSCR